LSETVEPGGCGRLRTSGRVPVVARGGQKSKHRVAGSPVIASGFRLRHRDHTANIDAAQLPAHQARTSPSPRIRNDGRWSCTATLEVERPRCQTEASAV